MALLRTIQAKKKTSDAKSIILTALVPKKVFQAYLRDGLFEFIGFTRILGFHDFGCKHAWSKVETRQFGKRSTKNEKKKTIQKQSLVNLTLKLFESHMARIK